VEEPKHTRRAIRFPLEVLTVFWWTDSGIEKRSEGRTRDISEMGAFVLANACPPSGIQIRFKVFLPVLGFEPQTRVEAVGQVLRVERSNGLNGPHGFAILTRQTLLQFKNDALEQEEESSRASRN
jgi:hypothetical protein